MRKVYSQAAISHAKQVASVLLFSLFVVCIFPVAASAQQASPADTVTEVTADDTPATGDEEDVPLTVQDPGEPTATSPPDDHDIVWEWAPPKDGLTPDAPVTDPAEPVEPTDQPVEPPTERPTDIIKYGYRLTNEGILVITEEVESNINTVTIKVINDGNYKFELWSINREAKLSAGVSGNITITSPVPIVPIFAPLEIPEPIGAAPIVAVASINNTSTRSSTYYIPNATPVTSTDTSASNVNVLSSTDTNSSGSQADTVAAVKPSAQGWVIIGLPWYIWLLVVAIIFTAWRWFAMVAKNKS